MRPANTLPLSDIATTVTIHSHNAARPASAYGTVNRYGSGLNDGAPSVLRFQWSV